jgi:hypothetical protein
MSAFYLWDPYLIEGSDRDLGFMITNGDVTGGIFRSKDFLEALLRDAELEVEVDRWSIEAYRSKYYSEYLDGEDWRDIWPVVWKVRVRAAREIGRMPKMSHRWIESNATGPNWTQGPKADASVGCLVVADFADRKDLEKAEQAVAGGELEASRREHSAKPPSFDRAHLKRFWELQIDLGEFPGRFFSEGAPYAESVINTCEKAGGRTHFEQRV